MRRIILGPVVFVLLVLGISLPTLIAFPFNVVIAAAAGLAVSLFSDRVIYVIVGKTKPTLLVEPLQILSFGAGANLERSQWVNMAWATLGSSHSLTALFGVVRIRALGDDAIECRIAARIKLQDYWLESGYLNWYSPSLVHNLTTIGDFQPLHLNLYLNNTSEHIPKDDSKDLLVCYTFEDNPAVFLCSDMATPFAGNVQNDQPLRFQVEITLTAHGLQKVVTILEVEARWGRLLIAKAAPAMTSNIQSNS